MAYDSQRGRTVLFGGYNTSNLGDTWEWTGSDWTLMSTSGLSARNSHAMAYDSQFGRTLLFGGANSTGHLSGTWGWDGANWTLRVNGPSARQGHAMVYDSQHGRTLLFGGYNLNNLGDTWEWHEGFLGTATTFGTGCGSPVLALSSVVRPIIDTTVQTSLTGTPSSVVFVALGWNRAAFGSFALPLSLTGFGMPGCELLQSSDAAALPTTSTAPGTATFSLRVPNNTGLIGLHVYLQGWAYAPGVNPGHTIVSNGIDWGIGNS
jgi:hypothetical protein